MNAKIEARLSDLREYIQARQVACILKGQGVPSPDWVLRAYRFPNVFRHQDKTTKWIVDQWIRPYYKHPRLWFALILARVFNLPRTLSLLGFPGQDGPKEWRDHALQVLAFIRESGAPAFSSSSYPITPHGHKGDKARAVVHDSLFPALVYFSQEETFAKPRTLESIWEVLMLHLSLGPVVCHEIAADFACTKYHKAGTDSDLWGFVSPPALDALCHIHGRRKIDQAEAREMVRDTRKIWPEFRAIPPSFIDLEHALVGFSRYISAKNGRPISKRMPKTQSPGNGPDGLPWAKGVRP